MRLAIATLLALGACQSSDVSRSLGARCDVDRECDELCLTTEPGGFCTTNCGDSEDCDHALCVRAPGSSDSVHGVCEVSCLVDLDCAFLGDGYQCRDGAIVGGDVPGAKVCDGL